MGTRLHSPSGTYPVLRFTALPLTMTMQHRTSGTEPKVIDFSIDQHEFLTSNVHLIQIKYYLEGSGKDPEAVKQLLPRVVSELANVWMEAEKNDLGRP